MKCVICGFDYDGTECPKCEWPNVQINGDEKDYDEWLRLNKKAIEEYRYNYFSKVGRKDCSIGILVIKGSRQDDNSVKPIAEQLYFGKMDELNDKWLSHEFVVYPNSNNEIQLTAIIKKDGKAQYKTAVIPNIRQAGLFKIMANKVDDDMFYFKIRDKAGVEGMSTPVIITGEE